MVVHVFIPEFSKLDFLNIYFDTQVTDVNIPQADVAKNCISTSVSDVLESIE